MKNKSGKSGKDELVERFGKEFGTKPRSDLNDPKVFRSFCKKYGAAIRPHMKAVDRFQAESMARASTGFAR